MPLYLKIANPFRVQNRQELSAYLSENVEGYAELKAQLVDLDARYTELTGDEEQNIDALFEQWEKENPEMTPATNEGLDARGNKLDELNKSMDALFAKWTEDGQTLSGQMKALVDAHFRHSKFDGIILEQDDGSKGRTVKSYIAFEPTQIKSVNNRGTFNPNDPRILYQDNSRRAAAAQAIRALPAQTITPGAPLDKKSAESLARSIGSMENKSDRRVVGLPVNTIGKILSNKGFDVTTILGDIPALFESSILGWSEKEILKEGHKAHPNIKAYHNYVNKFEQGGKEYFIRFTVQEMKAKAGQGPNHVHSSFVSEVGIYEDNAQSRWGRVINPVMGEKGVVVDKRLQDFFDSVKPGLALRQGPRGSVQIHDHNYLINLFKAADLSTLIHETAHIFQAELDALIESGAADETQVKAQAVLNDWLSRFDDDALLEADYNLTLKGRFDNQEFKDLSGFDKDQARAIAKKEYFARGFEAYIREGKAPNLELEGVFKQFKNWLMKIYRDAAQALGVELTDDVRDVFARMLAGVLVYLITRYLLR